MGVNLFRLNELCWIVNMLINLSPSELAKSIDYSYLKPFGRLDVLESICEQSIQYGFATVAVTPSDVGYCYSLLEKSNISVSAAISFPLGMATSIVKEFEVKDAFDRGATEIEMVINVRALQSGNTKLVNDEIAFLSRFCRENGAISKLILENCYLTDDEKVLVCRMAIAEGINFVKTSTGFGISGATLSDIRLMRDTVRDRVGVKAAGGIRDLWPPT